MIELMNKGDIKSFYTVSLQYSLVGINLLFKTGLTICSVQFILIQVKLTQEDLKYI